MARVCVPQGLCAGFDIPGHGRVKARGGIMDVPDHVARNLIKYDECFPAADAPKTAGFICEACGFHALIKTCGRCGGRCHRPGEINAQEAA